QREVRDPAADEPARTAVLVPFGLARGRGARRDATHTLTVVLDRIDRLTASTSAPAAEAPADSLGTDKHERPAVAGGNIRRDPYGAARDLTGPPLQARPVDLGRGRRRVPRTAAPAEVAARTPARSWPRSTTGSWPRPRAVGFIVGARLGLVGILV